MVSVFGNPFAMNFGNRGIQYLLLFIEVALLERVDLTLLLLLSEVRLLASALTFDSPRTGPSGRPVTYEIARYLPFDNLLNGIMKPPF